VLGRQITLLLDSCGNPVHTLVKRLTRSLAASASTWPPCATFLYCAVVAGTRTPPFMDLVLQNEGVRETPSTRCT
jgi:hypothetical protein